MKLYNFDSASPRRVRMFLAEKGEQIPLIEIDLKKWEQRSEEFLKKNPVGGVPVLELDDGTHIAESIAICRYLEAIYPNPPLFGTTPKESALIDMWIQRQDVKFLSPLGRVWVNLSPLTADAPIKKIPEAGEQGREQVYEYYKVLERRFAESEYIAGPNFSAADILLLSIMDMATKQVTVPLLPKHDNIRRWHAQVSARPSASA